MTFIHNKIYKISWLWNITI